MVALTLSGGKKTIRLFSAIVVCLMLSQFYLSVHMHMDQQPMVDNDDGVDFDATEDIDPNQDAKVVHEINNAGTMSLHTDTDTVTDTGTGTNTGTNTEAIKDDVGKDVKSQETHGDETETETVKEADDAQSEIVPEGKLNINHHRYDKVAIVTKIQKPKDIGILKQMFCFCNGAYNRYVNYDVVVFIAEPFTEKHVEELREITALVPPAKLTVALDGPSLEEHLATMTEEEIKFLYDRCGVKPGENITWAHHCSEPGTPHINNLAYAWQSEFRTYHIYKHPALAEYKYMIWFDSDAQCIEPWKKDPIKVMVENDLVLLYYKFPNGRSRQNAIKEKTKKIYNREICSIYHTNHHLEAEDCEEKNSKVMARQVHGFHHITNLDFYRNETQQKFLKIFVGDYKFSRMYDDQIGVTLPAVLGAPNKTSGYWDFGLNQRIFHKGQPSINGSRKKYKDMMGDKYVDLPIHWWNKGGNEEMEDGHKCDRFVKKPKDYVAPK